MRGWSPIPTIPRVSSGRPGGTASSLAGAGRQRGLPPPGWWCAGSRTPATATRCFQCGRHHPFLTNSDLPTADADIIHRRHAIIETTFADVIDGPLAHAGLFVGNCAWLARARR